MNKSIIITGAAGSFGSKIAIELAKTYDTILAVDISTTGNELFTVYDNIYYYNCDLTDFNKTNEVYTKIFAEHPETNVLINNAGSIFSSPLISLFSREDKKHSFENWQRTISLNLNTVFISSVNAVEQFVSKRTKALIINISSLSARGNMGQSAYSAAKAGVEALTKTWSKELSMFGIRAAAIAPGFFDTDSTHSALSSKIIENLTKQIPMGRLGNTDELVNAVKFIIENEYYNGKILELDGGMII